MRRPENVWPSYVCLSSLFPTVCLCVFTLSNCVFVCLSLLGIVFLPNAALYWLCEFLSRNRPNSGREFRSLREIMGQSEEIYGAHIEKRLKYGERKIMGGENTSWIVEIISQSGKCLSRYLSTAAERNTITENTKDLEGKILVELGIHERALMGN